VACENVRWASLKATMAREEVGTGIETGSS